MPQDLDNATDLIEKLMKDVSRYVRDNGARIFEGGASLAEATYLQRLARSAQAVDIAEIGFNVGFSSMAFLEVSPATRVVSFELNRRRAVELAKEFVDERYPGRHDLVIGNSVDTVPGYLEQNTRRFDLVFVDGGHTYDIAMADIRNACRIAKPGALIVMDDLVPWHPWGIGPHRAWREAEESGLVEVIESVLDGRIVDVIEKPGDRAWATGRVRSAPTP